MNDRDVRVTFIIIALGFLIAAWCVWGFDDTPSVWALVLLLVSAGVFSNLRAP